MLFPKSVRTFFPFALAVSIAAAAAGSLTEISVHHWYVRLAKPAWTVPSNVFGPVSTCMYAAMALAAWLVYKKVGWEGARTAPPRGAVRAALTPEGCQGAYNALTLWGIQLILNAFWPGFFFAMRNPLWGSIEIVILLGFVIATTLAFWRRDRVAGLLMLPYCFWATYAAALTLAIWRMNR